MQSQANIPMTPNRLTTADHICSLLSEKPATQWEKREWSQTGLNLTRILEKSDPGSAYWIYLYFLRENLKERSTVPAWLGRGWLGIQKLKIWLGIRPPFPLYLYFKDFKDFCTSLQKFGFPNGQQV